MATGTPRRSRWSRPIGACGHSGCRSTTGTGRRVRTPDPPPSGSRRRAAQLGHRLGSLNRSSSTSSDVGIVSLTLLLASRCSARIPSRRTTSGNEPTSRNTARCRLRSLAILRVRRALNRVGEDDVAMAYEGDGRLPVIYVRGFAGSKVDEIVDDPFYGFSQGSVDVRVDEVGEPRFHQFESPMLRLMSDERYGLRVQGDQRAYLAAQPDGGDRRRDDLGAPVLRRRREHAGQAPRGLLDRAGGGGPLHARSSWCSPRPAHRACSWWPTRWAD